MILMVSMAALLAQAEAKTMAHDDWIKTEIVAIGSPVAGDPAHYLTVQTGDLDGDSAPDDAYLKLACDGPRLTGAWYQVKGPRDADSGMASGKRQHKPLTIIKEWGASTPQLAAIKPTYDVKKVEGAGARTNRGWVPIGLAATDGLCDAARTAAKTITKTSSNIQNN